MHQPKKLGIRGVLMTGDYWFLRGLHITEAGDNGIKLEGNHNRIERCTFSYNDDTGLQLVLDMIFRRPVLVRPMMAAIVPGTISSIVIHT
jgi:hypothetical protein